MDKLKKAVPFILVLLLALYLAPRHLVAYNDSECVYAYNERGDEAQGTRGLVIGRSVLVWGHGVGFVSNVQNVRVTRCLPRLLQNEDLVYTKYEVIP